MPVHGWLQPRALRWFARDHPFVGGGCRRVIRARRIPAKDAAIPCDTYDWPELGAETSAALERSITQSVLSSLAADVGPLARAVLLKSKGPTGTRLLFACLNVVTLAKGLDSLSADLATLAAPAAERTS